MADAYSTEAEVWKPVVGCDGRYEVSNLGRVRSLRSSRAPRLLTGVKGSSGYFRVSIDGRAWLIHRLVLAAFVSPCPEGLEGGHMDGVRTNNALTNLQWITRRENMSHKRLHGTQQHGERNGQSKLTGDSVCELRAAYATGVSPIVLKDRYGISEKHVHRIVRREFWRHVSDAERPRIEWRRPHCAFCGAFLRFANPDESARGVCDRCGTTARPDDQEPTV